MALSQAGIVVFSLLGAASLLACSASPNPGVGASSPTTPARPAPAPIHWRLVHHETFDQPFAEPTAWVEDTYGKDSPYHVDAFSDDGAFFRDRGGEAFSKELSTFRSFRKSYRYGEQGWLTVEQYGRDADRDGVPESGGRFTSASGKAHLASARHTDAALLTSTDPLPARYRVEVTVSNVHFGGALGGSFVHDGKVNGYDGSESATPWCLPTGDAPPLPAWTDNGVYFLCVVDYPHPAPHNNVFIHHHRKVVLDTDNNLDWTGHPWSMVYNPFLDRPEEQGSHYAGLVFLRGDDFGSERTGNKFMSWTQGGFFQSSVFADRYLDGESYRFAIERDGLGYALEITGRFAVGGLTTYRAYRTFDGPPPIWHYNQTAAEGPGGRFDQVVKFLGQTTHTWPADAAYPDYLILGDPHINYYEGSADFDDLKLWVPEDQIPGAAAIWAVHDGEKVDRDDLHHPSKLGNTAWDGQTIRLFGARNEVLAFQLVVESDVHGISGLSVELPELKRSGGNEVLSYAPPGADPTEYAGRPIQIFTEHYMDVTKPSRARWVYQPGSPASPPHPTGKKPVQLVPENARAHKGGLPIDVPPRSNQAIWIEVYTGHNLPPGKYLGSVKVSAGGVQRCIPIELELLDFSLPDANSLTAMLYFEPEQVQLYMGADRTDRFHRFAHRSRVELVNGYTKASLQAAAGRFNGSDFSAAAGYDGPGKNTGNRIAPASFYGPPPEYKQQASARAASDAWMTTLNTVAPNAITFLYMTDEPSPAQYPEIQSIASFIHQNPGPGHALPIFVTSSYKPGLEGSIDIWCAPAQAFDMATAEAQRAKGRAYWFYNGRRPQTGALIIDTPATDARANAWAAFKHGVDVYFNWHSDHWEHNFQKVGDKIQNVWVNPVTFDNRGQPGKPVADQGFINGDGVLLYPGNEVLHPAEDRGIAGPISTIQLANLRRGVQDHLYLTIARGLGLSQVVSTVLQHVVPAVHSEAGTTVGFSEHGDDYEQARWALAQAIVGN